MNLNNSQKAFWDLVRLGIGTSKDAKVSNDVDWPAVKDLVDRQGLSGVVLDGIEVLRSNDNQNQDLNLPEKVFLLEWIGETLQDYDYRYEQYKQVIAEMADFYNSHSYKMMILKGYACSLDWPKPEHRPCGDIDIWQFGQQKDADAVLSKEQGIEIDASHHHHTVFFWGDFMVENHYDFVNVHALRSSAEMEKVFKELGREANLHLEHNVNLGMKKGCKIESVLVEGETVYLPSANLHALFLTKHMVSHFTSANISLRQVLDWAFFVEKHTMKIDWEWLNEIVEEYHMKDFFHIINAICVEDLGFDVELFPEFQYEPTMKERVFADIIDPAFEIEEPAGLVPRMVYKYKRWKGNAWKHELCYKESRWSRFWTGLWGHMLKPSSI